MEMATYLVTAVLVEGQSVRTVAQDHGVSKTWLYELVARYQADGEAGLVPRSRRPHRSPPKLLDLFSPGFPTADPASGLTFSPQWFPEPSGPGFCRVDYRSSVGSPLWAADRTG